MVFYYCSNLKVDPLTRFQDSGRNADNAKAAASADGVAQIVLLGSKARFRGLGVRV